MPLATLYLATATALAGTPSFGFVDVQEGQLFLHTSAALADIEVVYLQYPGNPKRCCLRRKGTQLTRTTPVSSVESIDSPDGAMVHRFAIASRQPPFTAAPFVGMALINVMPPVVASHAFMRGRTSHAAPYTVRQCLATEGINLYGPTQHGQAEHLYYGLGYEIDRKAVPSEVPCKD